MPKITSGERELAGHYLRELENPPKPLTSYELGVIETLDDTYHNGSLNDRQFERLETLYKRKCL